MAQNLWTRAELLPVLEMYFRTPFGKLHQRNPEIIKIAENLDRTPSAVAMKACNLASCDAQMKEKGIQGLGNSSKQDHRLFDEFLANPQKLLAELNITPDQPIESKTPIAEIDDHFPEGKNIETSTTKRLGHSFFRRAVYTNFEGRCAISGLSIARLLTASHIIPWGSNAEKRCDPRNGLLLSAVHDRAFDQGLISLSEDFRVLMSPILKKSDQDVFLQVAILSFENEILKFPKKPKFLPSQEAMAFHRTHIFQS